MTAVTTPTPGTMAKDKVIVTEDLEEPGFDSHQTQSLVFADRSREMAWIISVLWSGTRNAHGQLLSSA